MRSRQLFAVDMISVQNVYIGNQDFRVVTLTNNDLADQISNCIDEILEAHDTGTFKKHWEFYKKTVSIPVVQAFYLKTDPGRGYFNLAILGNGKLIDIDNEQANNSGSCSVCSLDSITGVILRAGNLPSFDGTKNATLVVLTDLTGGRANGPYWFAESPEEEESLLGFAHCLLELI